MSLSSLRRLEYAFGFDHVHSFGPRTMVPRDESRSWKRSVRRLDRIATTLQRLAARGLETEMTPPNRTQVADPRVYGSIQERGG